MIQPSRIKNLNDQPANENGKFVLYWMQQAVRSRFNHALEYAIRLANAQDLPVRAVFGLTDGYPEANERHYAFLLDGLADVQQALCERGIGLHVLLGSPDEVAIHQSKQAHTLVTDRGYTRIQREWRAKVAASVGCHMVQVETDAVVPIEEVSKKEEYAAATLRPKLHRQLEEYLISLNKSTPKHAITKSDQLDHEVDLSDIDALLKRLKIDRSVPRVSEFTGGETESQRRLEQFLSQGLSGYAEKRRDPSLNAGSHLSPYLHFGQLSPLDIALRVDEYSAPNTDKDSFLEELIVRRELSFNFVENNPHYDTYDCLPSWARVTLDQHRSDPRPHLYTKDELEAADTKDPYWNAAQREMVETGYMQNAMRMYWGKKILEWSTTPEEAFATALYLNNKYLLDGRDPNSYTGVAWCFGKHDRPWAEREVFGLVRYMNAAGLERKFDIKAYVNWIAGSKLAEQGQLEL